MSGKGGQQQGGTYGGGGYQAPPPATGDNPQIITGWEHSLYAHKNVDRYAYLGKDDNREPQWLDWGSKSANAAADAAKQGGSK